MHAWNNLLLRGYTGTISQELGSSEDAVVSQKVVTEELRKSPYKHPIIYSNSEISTAILDAYESSYNEELEYYIRNWNKSSTGRLIIATRNKETHDIVSESYVDISETSPNGIKKYIKGTFTIVINWDNIEEATEFHPQTIAIFNESIKNHNAIGYINITEIENNITEIENNITEIENNITEILQKLKIYQILNKMDIGAEMLKRKPSYFLIHSEQ